MALFVFLVLRFLSLILFFCVIAPVWVHVVCMKVPSETRREHCAPWSWHHRQLWAPRCRSFGRAERALDHWVVFLSLICMYFIKHVKEPQNTNLIFLKVRIKISLWCPLFLSHIFWQAFLLQYQAAQLLSGQDLSCIWDFMLSNVQVHLPRPYILLLLSSLFITLDWWTAYSGSIKESSWWDIFHWQAWKLFSTWIFHIYFSHKCKCSIRLREGAYLFFRLKGGIGLFPSNV